MKFFHPDDVRREKSLVMSKQLAKYFRDAIAYRDGSQLSENGRAREVIYNPADPATGNPLLPGRNNPFCGKCLLSDNEELQHPYLEPRGSHQPLVTIVIDSVSKKSDETGDLFSGGQHMQLRRLIVDLEKTTGVGLRDIRWVPLTRCAAKFGTNFKIKGNWCRNHLIDDLMRYPPKLVLPVGTTALGALSHKSNAQDWGGRMLTWRGWPDDWLMNPAFALPRPCPGFPDQMVTGHPLFGAPPQDVRIPLLPIQSPRLVYGTGNQDIITTWVLQIANALDAARNGVPAPCYDRPWYRLTEDPAEVAQAMAEICSRPGHLLSYDTETTGLRPLNPDAAIVFMMFRWVDGQGRPRALGFPWDYAASGLRPHIRKLTPKILEALYCSKLIGHNLSFDVLYTHATLENACLDWLADAMYADTMHMAYTFRQQRGSLGLEHLAYEHAPDLAGYEEEMTLLIGLHYELLHPDGKKGGHYANCPKNKWETHFKPYVMGDVEAVWESRKSIQKKLDSALTYTIPIARPGRPGSFRNFPCPRRDWVYRNIMVPASSVLTKLMGRGLYVSQDVVKQMLISYPGRVTKAAEEFEKNLGLARPRLRAIIDSKNPKKADVNLSDKEWRLDLENKTHLKTVLFDQDVGLGLAINRLTKKGRVLFGETPEDWAANRVLPEQLLEYAAVDKFTLNAMAVNHEQIRPLQEYRKLFKLYTAYIRPMADTRTVTGNSGQELVFGRPNHHLCADGCVHAQFKLTGTRGGRLSSCLPVSTSIFTDKGLMPIGEVILGDLVQTPYGMRRITGAWKTGLKPVLKFELSNGSSLTCTAQHKVFCNGRWTEAGSVRPGDSLYTCGQPAQFAEAMAEAVPSKSEGRKPIKLPKLIDERVAFVLGHFLAEGCISFHRARPSVNRGKGGNQSARYPAARTYLRKYRSTDRMPVRLIVAFGWIEKDLQLLIAKEYEELFGLEPVWTDGTCPQLVFNSIDLANWMLAQGLGGKANAKRLPGWLWNSPRSVVLAFLRGLFEGDGTASAAFPALDTSSNLLAQDVGLLLSKIGWHYRLNRHQRANGKWRYRVQAYADSTADFSELFWSDRKKSKLKQPVLDGCVYCPEWFDLNQFDRSSATSADHVFYSRIRRKKLTYFTSSRLRFLADRAIEGSSVDYVKWALETKARSCMVETIEQLPLVETCDIEVQDTACFLVNGVCVHNSNPNLQQLPRVADVKGMYVSRFGKRGCMYSADLSQIELRLLAAGCGDPSMVKAYYEGTDLHSLTTSRIFDVPYEHFSKEYMEWLQANGKDKEAKLLDEQRQTGKTANFLTGYGGGAFGLQTTLANKGIYKTIEECEIIIAAFFDAYPTLRRHIQYYKQFILDNGVALSMFGRVRVFEEVFGSDDELIGKALRAGYNHLIQSTASDMMLIALFVIEQLMREEGLESILVSTVHDSLVIDSVRQELPKVHEITMAVLNNFEGVFKAVFGPDYDTSWMILPFAGDGEAGRTYLSMRKIKGESPDWDQILAA